MHERAGLSALAAAAFVLVSSSYLPAAWLLRFATLPLTEDAARAALLFAVVAAAALAHERLVRGALYARVRESVRPGLGAALVALAGAVAPVVARLLLLPRPPAPLAVRVAHALQVEFFLGLGLAWLALGSGSWLLCGIALALVWAVRLFVTPVFHGGVVPLLEAVFALLAALSVAGVLARPLAPHRAAVLESE